MLLKYFILITLVALFIAPGKLTAQLNRSASIIGYAGIEYRYFSEMNAQAEAELKTLDSSYNCYVSFRVDTAGRLIDFSITEVPFKRMPLLLINYITKLVYSTDGKWLPQLKDSRKVTSDEIVWFVGVVNANKSIDDRADEVIALTQKEFDIPLAEREKMKFYYAPPKYLLLSLVYHGLSRSKKGDIVTSQ